MTRDEAISLASISFQLPGRKSGAEAFMETLAEHGFVVVPREPTKEMIEIGNDTIDENIDSWNYDSDHGFMVMTSASRAAWLSMITTYKDEVK